MIWQDIIITIANLLFTISLINQVVYGFRKKKGLITLTTSFLTTLGLYAITIAFLTLGLPMSALVSCVNGTLWLILLIQRIIYKKV